MIWQGGLSLHWCLLWLFTIANLESSTALYPRNGPVVVLTPTNFDKLVLQSNVVSVVEFFAPWCGHCKALAPAYQKVAESHKGILLVGSVDCDNKKNQVLCGRYGIQGFPTIKVFPVEKQKNPKNGVVTKEPEDYNGPRNVKGIATFATARIPSAFVKEIRSSSDFQAFVDDGLKKRAVLFTDKQGTPVLFKSLSARYQQTVTFAQVHSSLSEIASEFKIKKYPSIILFKEGKSYEHYEGDLKPPALVAFFDEFTGSGTESSETSDAKEEGDTARMDLKMMNLEELESASHSEDVFLIAFRSKDHATEAEEQCKKDLLKVATAVKTIRMMVRVGVMEVAKEEMEAVKKFGVDSNQLLSKPCNLQLIRFPFGEDKEELDEYQMYDGPIEAKSLQEFVIRAMPSLATELDAQGIEPFVGGMGSQGNDPMRPKVLLFTAKEECPSIYNALAYRFRNWKMSFGYVPQTDESVKEQFQIPKLPLILAVQIDPNIDLEKEDEPENPPKVPVRIHPYPGPSRFLEMASWLSSFGAKVGAQPSGEEGSGSSNSEPMNVVEIGQDSDLSDQCGKVGICVIALLDPRADSHTKDMKVVEQLFVKRRNDPLRFVWVDAPPRLALMEGFSIVGSDVPTILALSMSKMRFGVLREELTFDNADSFLNGILNGRITTMPLETIPSMTAGAAPEDNEPQEVIEDDVDEVDLSTIMSEEIDGVETKEELLKRIDEELEAEQQRMEEEAKISAEKTKKKKKKKKGKKKQAAKDEL